MSRPTNPIRATASPECRSACHPNRRRIRRSRESYAFDNKRLAWETIPALLDSSSPLRTSHLRDPVGPQIHFASEQFIDELAVAVGEDPVAFRLKYAARRAMRR